LTVIRLDGLEHASVRNVAREAGLSMGALRHYFATQSELLCFAMQLVGDRARARIAASQPVAASGRRHPAGRLVHRQQPGDEGRLPGGVRLAITGELLAKPALHFRVGGTGVRIGP